jgi:uncharacterized membrane protein (DUF106 family)
MPHTLDKVLQSRKEKFLAKIQLSSPGLVFLHWLLTNWITILIAVAIGCVFLIQYKNLRDLKENLLKTQIEALNLDLEKAKIEKEKLLIRIKDLDTMRKDSLQKSKNVKKEVSKLSLNEKRDLLLEYKKRLLKKKGL